jgi:hypothetical protein
MADPDFTWRRGAGPDAPWHCVPAGRHEGAALCGEPIAHEASASRSHPERPVCRCPACERLAAERGIR